MRFVTASTIDGALAALAAGARPIAGGSDLMVGHRQGKAPLPDFVVGIDRIDDLRQIDGGTQELTIGALVSHHTLETDPHIAERYSALADASALVGSPSTRNVGTLGGNVMNASPAMDTGAPLVVLGAEVELRSAARGSRRLPVSELWAAPGRTTAADDELCTAIHLPHPVAQSGSAYVRLEFRRAMEIAVVGAAANVAIAHDGSVAGVAVALTAVAPTIVEVSGLEGLLGQRADEAFFAAIAELAASQARPITDLRASERYRRHCVGVMARRAAEAAARRARGEIIKVPVNRALGIGAAS
jgi:CO/xanthine dehydrogenase FAD-binding subunit